MAHRLVSPLQTLQILQQRLLIRSGKGGAVVVAAATVAGITVGAIRGFQCEVEFSLLHC
jgi:hypothetical protein